MRRHGQIDICAHHARELRSEPGWIHRSARSLHRRKEIRTAVCMGEQRADLFQIPADGLVVTELVVLDGNLDLLPILRELRREPYPHRFALALGYVQLCIFPDTREPHGVLDPDWRSTDFDCDETRS